MAMKNSKSGPVGDKAQRSSQQRKPAPVPLRESDWAFHKVPREKLRYCAMWELGRLWGNKQKSWFDLTPKAKERFVIQDRGSGLQEIPANVAPLMVGPFARCLGHSFGEDYSALKPITFLVNFREREGKLRELLKLWLKSSPQRKKWQKKTKPPKDRWRSLLAKIVVLRATEAGLTREAAIQKTSVTSRNWGAGQKG
jgi:hypothetical protein